MFGPMRSSPPLVMLVAEVGSVVQTAAIKYEGKPPVPVRVIRSSLGPPNFLVTSVACLPAQLICEVATADGATTVSVDVPPHMPQANPTILGGAKEVFDL